MPRGYWFNKAVLVTGNEGFLGSHLSRRLIGEGAKLVGLDIKRDTKHSLLTKAERAHVHSVKGSVANYRLVKGLLKRYRIRHVFHLAAEAIVAKALQAPLEMFRANIQGTWNVLEACRESANLESVLVASSDKAYGDHRRLPYTESTALFGQHPYDVSKSCTDLIATTYFKTYRLPVAVVRSGNIYGPADFNFSRVIPDCIRCAHFGKVFRIRSNGKFTRDYVYVDDIVEAYLLLAKKMKSHDLAGEAFNFSNESPLTVLQVVREIYKTMGKEPRIEVLDQAKHEIKHQYLDASKAKRSLAWKPTFDFQGGLKETIAWYQNYLSLRSLNSRIGA